MGEKGKYKIVWHFEGTTLTKSYDTEAERDEHFEGIHTLLAIDHHFIKIDDIIFNANQVLCISKEEEKKKTRSIN